MSSKEEDEQKKSSKGEKEEEEEKPRVGGYNAEKRLPVAEVAVDHALDSDDGYRALVSSHLIRLQEAVNASGKVPKWPPCEWKHMKQELGRSLFELAYDMVNKDPIDEAIKLQKIAQQRLNDLKEAEASQDALSEIQECILSSPYVLFSEQENVSVLDLQIAAQWQWQFSEDNDDGDGGEWQDFSLAMNRMIEQTVVRGEERASLLATEGAETKFEMDFIDMKFKTFGGRHVTFSYPTYGVGWSSTSATTGKIRRSNASSEQSRRLLTFAHKILSSLDPELVAEFPAMLEPLTSALAKARSLGADESELGAAEAVIECVRSQMALTEDTEEGMIIAEKVAAVLLPLGCESEVVVKPI